ncbi:MAG: GNAT family N-acetyltransferase [Solirubrobacteraceae bacterium]
MSGGLAPAAGLELIERIEAHCVRSWPPSAVEYADDGWVLRATPGLPGRGRSNHALAPVRSLSPEEIEGALERAMTFAGAHGIECGLQVGPLELHIPLLDTVAARGWEIQQSVLVMTAEPAAIAADADPAFELLFVDHVTSEWLATWQCCEPERANAAAHVDTVFGRMAGGALFARLDQRAVGIVVERDGIAGLYCLAVNPAHRRQGLGSKLVRGLLASVSAPAVYLQVFSGNPAGLALYDSLGFTEAYRYCHCRAPTPALSHNSRA